MAQQPSGGEPAAAADYSHLPSDVLCLVFKQLLAPPSGLPASEAHARWLACRLTCKQWCEVLDASPPPACTHVAAVPERLFSRWLLALPLRALSLDAVADEVR